MKEIIFVLLLYVLLIVPVFGQTQQGVVKTKGRIVNGQLLPGKGLPGATVTIQGGNSYNVQNNNGSFSFPIPSKTFIVKGVQKKGYQLVDADVTKKSYQYSSNPLCLVMETPEQHSDDILYAERKLRLKLEQQLHERENEIETLKAQNKITQEEYRVALQQLYKQQDNNTNLISQLASRYASIDYDQINEEDRIINDCILNGQFAKADSILKSKGSFGKRFEKLQREGIGIEQTKIELGQAQVVHKRDIEDFGRDCYAMFELCNMRYEADSAAYYIQLRAKADTMNVEWQYDVAFFLSSTLADYEKAMMYCDKALNLSISKYGEKSIEAATCYMLKSDLYQEQAQYENSFNCLNRALEIASETESASAQASCCGGLARLCNQLERISEAEEWIRKEEQLLIHAYGENTIELADLYQRLANILLQKGEAGIAATYHEKALNMLKETYGEEHEKVAHCYHTLAQACMSLHHYPLALEYLQKELTIYMKSPDSNKYSIGLCYQSMGIIYEMGDSNSLKQASECVEKSISLLSEVYGKGHPDLATGYLQMGIICANQKHFTESEQFCKRALDILEKVYGHDHPKVALCYSQIGSVLAMSNNYDHALKYLSKSEEILNCIYGTATHTSSAPVYVMIGLIYAKKGDMAKAKEYYKKVEHISNITESVPMVKQLQMILEAADKVQKKMIE